MKPPIAIVKCVQIRKIAIIENSKNSVMKIFHYITIAKLIPNNVTSM